MALVSNICAALSLIISIFAFAHGASRLLKKDKPLYCQVIMWAVACYCLECLETCVVYLCGDLSDQGIIGRIAICGFSFALLSANYGAIDSIVDDRSEENNKYKKLALLAPALLLVANVAGIINIYPEGKLVSIVYAVSALPSLPASYFALKHLLLPKDRMGFLACTKMCNILSLIIYALGALILIIYGRVPLVVNDIINLVISILVLGLTLAAEKGEKSWPI